MKRGPKPKERALPRQPLTADPPKELVGRAREIYRKLAKELAVEGYASQSDWRTVALAAKTEAHIERLEEAVAALESLVMLTATGQRIHPLVAELRATRGQLTQIYGSLFLSPRARSSSRLAADVVRNAPAMPDAFDDFMAKDKDEPDGE